MPYHVTQRGVDGCDTFRDSTDRETYLALLRQNLPGADTKLLGWCLMPNHVHLVLIPQREESLAVLLRRVHGRYAQYFNARQGRCGHLWQNRYFACPLGPSHLWAAPAYVDNNPVRAGLVQRAGDYRWSSAAAHLGAREDSGALNVEWWTRESQEIDWSATLDAASGEAATILRRCTYAGRPYGDDEFAQSMSQRFGRQWVPGRPPKPRAVSNPDTLDQTTLFASEER